MGTRPHPSPLAQQEAVSGSGCTAQCGSGLTVPAHVHVPGLSAPPCPARRSTTRLGVAEQPALNVQALGFNRAHGRSVKPTLYSSDRVTPLTPNLQQLAVPQEPAGQHPVAVRTRAAHTAADRDYCSRLSSASLPNTADDSTTSTLFLLYSTPLRSASSMFLSSPHLGSHRNHYHNHHYYN